MTWEDIIVTPLFWIVSAIGTIVLSIVGNLLTPYGAAFVARSIRWRRTGVRKKQKARRDQVIQLDSNIHSRTSTKLDAVFALLLATVALLTCLFLFQLSFGALHESLIKEPPKRLEFPLLLIILVVLFFIVFVLKRGLDRMTLALTADRRERARNDFIAARPADASAVRLFEDEWDLKTFGVNSQSDL